MRVTFDCFFSVESNAAEIELQSAEHWVWLYHGLIEIEERLSVTSREKCEFKLWGKKLRKVFDKNFKVTNATIKPPQRQCGFFPASFAIQCKLFFPQSCALSQKEKMKATSWWIIFAGKIIFSVLELLLKLNELFLNERIEKSDELLRRKWKQLCSENLICPIIHFSF